jgi:hypothetical protein
MSAIYSLDALKFDNSFYNQLPADPVINNNSRHVNAACYSKVNPMPFPKATQSNGMHDPTFYRDF